MDGFGPAPLLWGFKNDVVVGNIEEVVVTRNGDHTGAWLEAHAVFSLSHKHAPTLMLERRDLYLTWRASVDINLGKPTMNEILEVTLTSDRPFPFITPIEPYI